MRRALIVISAAVVITTSLIACGKKQEADPVPADDSKYASPQVKASPGPGGAAGSPSSSQSTAPSAQ